MFGSSDTLSSTDSSESSVSSLTDESLNRTNRHRRIQHVHIKQKYDINVSQTSGPVAIGSKTANITSHSHSRGAEGGDLLSADSSPSSVTSTRNFQSEQDRLQEKNGIQFGEPSLGTYCLNSHSKLHCTEKEETWKPSPSSGIRTNDGDEECPWAIQSFFDDPECFIQEMNKSADVSKERREQFILLTILPHLEREWGKCSSSNEEVYKILAKVSRSINSGKVVKHALQLLFHLICKANFGSGNDNLLVVETVIRSSMFIEAEHSEGNLKFIVYSRILSLLLIQQVCQEKLPIVTLENDLKRAQELLRPFVKGSLKKDKFRYSLEFILQTIDRLLKPHDKPMGPTKLKSFIEECHEFCGNSKMQRKDLKIIQTLETKKKFQWNDLHCALIHLHGKVHSERPVPQIKTERRAMLLIRLIVEAYLKGGGGGDWRFCLLASSILVDIAKNNVTKEMRKEAGGCLVNFLKDEKALKRPECRALLQQQSSQLQLCPDRETRKILVHFLSKNQQSEEALPPNLHMEHLSSMYSTQTLEINETIVHKSSSCFISHGMFQRKKVAVKVLYVKKSHLLEEDLQFQARERLIREVYNMRRLNASQHPNYFPALFGYDTKSFPYHVITGFEKYGDLLQFVRMSRERDTHLKPIDLLRMLANISCALLYLEELGLVHRAVMAENVLVGDNYVCKLSGLHSLQQLTRGKDEERNSQEGYCSVVPEIVSTSNDEDLPVRWKAPECLTDYRYSTASDVWAFGVLMYEVLTYGCTPYRHVWDDKQLPSRVVDREEIVLQETCFINSEYELMKQCCQYSSQHRLKLSEVNKRLDELLDQTEEDEKRPDPPPLIMRQATFGSYDVEDDDELHGSISEITEECNLESVEEDQDETADLYEDVKRESGAARILERILHEDDQHIRALVGLNNPNLVSMWIDVDSHYWIISQECPNGNLKDYVLDRRCNHGDIVMFMSQVASAVHYLHVNHIVHGDLRAEYVNVLNKDKVQVGHLGRSKTLSMSEYEVTSTSCVVQADMLPDSTRWSAPEVISDGHYSHASDVWAFGILAWELYTSFVNGQDRRDFSIPYHGLYDDEILPYMREEKPLDRPEGCPDWVYIIMHQCWPYDSTQRPPFLAIVDCLTSREPMKSWIMQVWLRTHDERKWPDLSICQPDEACHVLDTEKHPAEHNIKRMCSEDFFAKHSYRYVHKILNEDDDDIYSSCPSRESSEAKKISSSIPEYEEPYSSPRYQPLLPSDEDLLDCSCPVEKNADQSDDTRDRSFNEIKMQSGSYTSEVYLFVNDAGRLDVCPSSLCQMEQEDCTIRNRPVANIPDDSTCRGVHQNKACTMDQDECAIYDKPAAYTPEDGTCRCINQNKACKMGQEECAIYDKPAAANTLEESTCRCINQNKAGKMGQEECAIYDKPAAANTPEDSTFRCINQNKAWKMGQEDCAIYDKPTANTSQDNTCCDVCRTKAFKMGEEDCAMYDKSPVNIPEGRQKNREYLDMEVLRQAQIDNSHKGGKQQARKRKKSTGSQPNKQKKCQSDNKENIFQNMGSERVPHEAHVYEKVKTANERDCNLSSDENVHAKPLNHGQDVHVERHSSVLQASFTSLEVAFDQI